MFLKFGFLQMQDFKILQKEISLPFMTLTRKRRWIVKKMKEAIKQKHREENRYRKEGCKTHPSESPAAAPALYYFLM